MIKSIRGFGLLACVLAMCLAPGSTFAATIHVPGDWDSIGEGVAAAVNGDTVLVACGSYAEKNIVLEKDIHLHGETGDPACVLIDAEGLGQGSILACDSLDTSAEIKGITFRASSAATGGAISLVRSSPSIAGCVFEENEANYGGAIYCSAQSSPQIFGCVFRANAASQGGGIYCTASATLFIRHCTFSENSAYWGAGIDVDINSQLTLLNTIIAASTSGEAVHCGPLSSATLSCCNLFGNADGDWEDCVADQLGQNDNFSADPEFCGVEGSGNLYLQSDSPCSSDLSPCGSQIGALGVGCDETSVATESWSAIKALY